MSSELSSALSIRTRDDSQYNVPTQRSEERDSCRVLLVDDDALVCARLSALLHACQYEVEVATTGKEALRILDETHCHIVLTDWLMPDMDGLALCRRIRLGNYENYIYVLMLTIRDTEQDVMIGLAAGADDYMVKGAAINDLLARVEIGRRITHKKSPHRMQKPGNRSVFYTNPLTGAHNLGYLVEHLPRELARSQRHGRALAILHCQIDGFKSDDVFGTTPAHDFLRTLVSAAEGCIRKGDWLAWTAGAAFMIVLPETTASGAHCAARKLRRLFAQPIPKSAEQSGFSVTIGVTVLDTAHDAHGAAQIDALLRIAGAAYAKRPGVLANVDATGWTSGSSAAGGEKNELN